MEIVFNKAAVRMLPAELNKATGLAAARENCGTEGSNPLPSSGESANFRFLASIIRLSAQKRRRRHRVFAA
jgi:hypothetical protein